MSAPLAQDHAPSMRSHRSRTTISDSEKDESGLSDSDEDDKSHDGHRPTRLEMIKSLSRQRTQTQRNQDLRLTQTVSRRQTALSRLRTRPVPNFTHPLAHEQTTEVALVDFDGPDDPYKPMNWPTKKKITTTLLYRLVTMTATWASSAYSAGTRQVAQQFRVGNEVATLGTTLFLFGLG